MQQKHKTYLSLMIVFIVSLIIFLLLPLNDIFKGLIATPLIGTLLGALYQILRDQAAFEKELLFQQKEHIFSLGATSHMANAIFDKHVSFCEEYMAEIHRCFHTLVAEGVTDKVTTNAFEFSKIRQKYSAWITNDISKPLERFEGVLHDIAAKAREIDRTPDGTEQLSKKLQEAESTWRELLGPLFNKDTPKDKKSINVECIKTKLREALSIEKLTQVRQWIIDQATKNIQ